MKKKYSFKWRFIMEYLAACDIYGWEPSWEGAEGFKRTYKKRQLWLGDYEERSA